MLNKEYVASFWQISIETTSSHELIFQRKFLSKLLEEVLN